MFLQETKVLASFFSSRKFLFGFHNYLVVDRVGLGGGFGPFVEKKVKLEIVRYSSNFIYRKCLKEPNNAVQWMIFGIYENSETERRQETWTLIRFLCQKRVSLTLILGDFNEMLYQNEKWDGRICLEKQIKEFRAIFS